MGIFDSLFGKKEKTVLGIDIGASAIKVVQLTSKKGKAVLQTYGALALGPYAGEEIGRATNLSTGKLVEALTDILREAKTTTKVGAVAIPFNASLITIIELPAASEPHLATVIPLEAKKYIPVPINEVSLDWSVIPSYEVKPEKSENNDQAEKQSTDLLSEEEGTSKIKVLIVAIHNDIVKKHKDIVEKSSLDADFFEIEIFSTLRSVVNQKTGSIAILDVGAASTKLLIVERGNVVASHIINKGSQDITFSISRSLSVSVKEAEILKRTKGLTVGAEPEKVLREAISITLDHIFSEANKFLINFEEKSKRKIDNVVLVGGGSSMRGFVEYASVHLQTKVFKGDPFSKVEAPVFVSEILKKSGPEFAVAVGIALRRLSEDK